MKWGLVAVLGLNLVHTEAFVREDFAYDVVHPIMTVDADAATHGRRRANDEHPLSSRTLQHDEHYDEARTDYVHAHARSLLMSLPVKDRTVTFECVQLAGLYHPHYVRKTHEGEQYGAERCQYSCRDINHPDATPGVLLTCNNNLHGALHIDGIEHYLEPAHYLDPDQKHVQRTSTHGTEHVLHEASEFADKHPVSLKNSHQKVEPRQRRRRMDKEIRVVDMEVMADWAFYQYHNENAQLMAEFYMAASYVIFNTEAFAAEYRLAIKRLVLVTDPGFVNVPPNSVTTGGIAAESYLEELERYHQNSNVLSATVVGISGHDLNKDGQNGGGVAGLAGLLTLCNANAAGVSQGFTFSRSGYDLTTQKSAYGTIAHEIGHNFGGNHECETFGTCERKIMNYGSFDQFKGWTDGGYWTESNIKAINDNLAPWPNTIGYGGGGIGGGGFGIPGFGGGGGGGAGAGRAGTCAQIAQAEGPSTPILQPYDDRWSECVDGKQYRSDQCYGQGKEEYCTIRNQGVQCRLCGSNEACPTADDVCNSLDPGTVSRGGTCAAHRCGSGGGGFGGGGFGGGGFGGGGGGGSNQPAPEGMPCPSGEDDTRTKHKFCLTKDGVMACRPPPPGTGAPPPPPPPVTPPTAPPTGGNNPGPNPNPVGPNPAPPVGPNPGPPPTTDEEAAEKDGGSGDLTVIIAIIVGGVVLLALIGFGLFFFMWRRDNSSGGKAAFDTSLSLSTVGDTTGNSYSGIAAPSGPATLPAYGSSPAKPAPYSAKPSFNRAPSFSATKPKPARPPPAKPAGKKASFNKVWDPNSKKFYYVNEVTGKTQWDAPN